MGVIPSQFLFRFRFTCRSYDAALTSRLEAEALGEEYRLPIWTRFPHRNVRGREVNEGVGRSPKNQELFDFRCGWSKEGLLFTVVVSEKKEKEEGFWTRSTLHSADVLRVCIDTRDLRDCQRGTRFCHKFAFYPFVGESLEVAKPMAQWLPISRAQEIPNAVDVDLFKVASERRDDGYAMSAFLPTSTLTGYDPNVFDRFGLHYAVADSQHGLFTLQHGFPFPFEDNPSMWSSIQMEGAAET